MSENEANMDVGTVCPHCQGPTHVCEGMMTCAECNPRFGCNTCDLGPTELKWESGAGGYVGVPPETEPDPPDDLPVEEDGASLPNLPGASQVPPAMRLPPGSSVPSHDIPTGIRIFEQFLEWGVGPRWREDAELRRTPERMARAWAEKLSGYRPLDQDTLTSFPSDYDGLVIRVGIPFTSACAHHGEAYTGHALVAYHVNGRILGISKLIRIVQHYARRLWSQEPMTKFIAQAISDAAKAKGVFVSCSATHLCEACRGVRVPDVPTITPEVLGTFRDQPHLKQEVLALASLEQGRK